MSPASRLRDLSLESDSTMRGSQPSSSTVSSTSLPGQSEVELNTPTPSASAKFSAAIMPPTPRSARTSASPTMDAEAYSAAGGLSRSTSIRSNGSHRSFRAPIGDFQSDDVLNASSSRQQHLFPALPSPPVSGSGSGPGSAVGFGFFDRSPPSSVSGARTPTHNGGWNPFVPPGLDGWTRESWARRKVALISGITGQDGSYLTEVLLQKGYTVHGIIRRSSSFNTSRLHHLYGDVHDGTSKMFLHYGDLTDSTNLVSIISQVRPSEIYNLGAQSHVKVSFEMAEYTTDWAHYAFWTLYGRAVLVKFYQASTSELYGQVKAVPQNEETPFHPRSPYGVAKLYAYWTVVNYREAYGMFACNGILFNHESPRRGRTFVTRKITRAVAEISLGKQDCLYMGNLDALRDWGHDYVEGMWRILQHNEPTDFVLASGENHSVRSFIEKSFAVVGVAIKWLGQGTDEIGVDVATNRVLVRIDPKYFRPAEVDQLLGDPAKAEKLLGWKRTVGFEDLVREMVLADVASARDLVEDHN